MTDLWTQVRNIYGVVTELTTINVVLTTVSELV